MKLFKNSREVDWITILIYYTLILIATYIARKLPNFLSVLLAEVSDIPFTFNYNHGIALVIVTAIFYKIRKGSTDITFFGNGGFKSLFFPAILFTCYGIYGINNDHGVDKHLWALLICFFAFIYNLMEEYAWRGYLINKLCVTSYIFKSLVSGVMWSVWHLLVFKDFNMYGGFWVFFAFCIIFSLILTFSVLRTKSVIAAAAIHAFLIQTNGATIVCFALFMILLTIWPMLLNRKTNNIEIKNPAM